MSVISQRRWLDIVAFGHRLRYWRTMRRWTQEELALLARQAQRSLGSTGRPITASWVRMMERGADGLVSSIRRSHLSALALSLDIPVSLLAPDVGGEYRGDADRGHPLAEVVSRYAADVVVWYRTGQDTD